MLKIFIRNIKTTKDIGNELEERVEKLLITQGYKNVKRNTLIYDKYGNKSEIDVMGKKMFRNIYVECKNYSRPIDFDKVAKFKVFLSNILLQEVLLLNNLDPKDGLFVTTSTYTPRCRTVGVKCVDGDELKQMEIAAELHRKNKIKWYSGLFTLILCFMAYDVHKSVVEKGKQPTPEELENKKKRIANIQNL